jgi:hypothetical protein
MVRPPYNYKVFPITAWISLTKALDSTKCCPVCGERTFKNRYYIAINVLYKSENEGKAYSAGRNYMHINCLNEFYKNAVKVINENHGHVKLNLLKVLAEQI